jgi:muramoyltetrapeptide carboxypeptidase
MYIDGASKVLSEWGLNVTEGKHARGKFGRFSGAEQERVEDLQNALDDNDVSAILCSRGGYGLSQIIDRINFSIFEKNPKWIIGFSDITVLHNAVSRLNIASIHGIMAKHLTELPFSAEPVVFLKNILFGKIPCYQIDSDDFNKTGTAIGRIAGGNLSVLFGLRATPFDLNFADKILLIEDIGEKPYHIDRMIQNLRIGGVFSALKGLIVGQFSDCEDDPQMCKTVREIILYAVREYDYPVCFNFPVGHEKYNLPIILGKEMKLSVGKKVTLEEEK